MLTDMQAQLRELDHRSAHGIDVSLLWDPDSNRVLLAVEDHRLQESIRLEVPAADALHAFHHPFLYIHSDSACHALAA
jgi:hypothetical protein